MARGPIALEGTVCPLLSKDVSKVCHKCAWYTLLRGTSPNTGNPVDEWGCAIAWLPILSVEIAQKANSTGAAVESLRNEVVKQEYADEFLIQNKAISHG